MNQLIAIMATSIFVASVVRCLAIAAFSMIKYVPPAFIMADIKMMLWAHARDESILNILLMFYLLPMAIIVFVISKVMLTLGKTTQVKGLWASGMLMHSMSQKFLLSGRWLV